MTKNLPIAKESIVDSFSGSINKLDLRVVDLVFQLRPDELRWTGDHPTGTLCFYEKNNKQYFGISFQGIREERTPWEISRKYHQNAPEISNKYSKRLFCRYPAIPGTFRVLAAPKKQLIVIQKLLAIARTFEQNRFSNGQLKQQYQDFVQEFGSINNFKSYWHNPVWLDIRLANYLEQFEIPVKSIDNKREILVNYSLFKEQDQKDYQQFPGLSNFKTDQSIVLEEILDSRGTSSQLELKIEQAFEFFYSQTGTIKEDQIQLIAQKLQVSPSLIIEKLRLLNLAFLEPRGEEKGERGKGKGERGKAKP